MLHPNRRQIVPFLYTRTCRSMLRPGNLAKGRAFDLSFPNSPRKRKVEEGNAAGDLRELAGYVGVLVMTGPKK